MKQQAGEMTNQNGRRKGQASIELVMSLIFFVMMLGTILSLSMYMYVQHTFLTGAKEGARAAAVNTNLANAGTYATGESEVKATVTDFVSSTTNIALDNNDIDIDGPSGAVGNRTVTITISHQFENPVQIRTFIDRLNGGSAEGLDTFTINGTATMRYEE